MTDTGVLELLGCCPRLTGLELPANSRITRSSLEAMVDSKRPVGSALTSLSLVSESFKKIMVYTRDIQFHRIE